MNLKKKTELLDDELNEEHDYNPSWDYEEDPNVDDKMVDFAFQIKNDIEKNILPEIKMFKKITIYLGKIPRNVLGIKFVNGTHAEPVFVLDAQHILKGMKKYKVDMEEAIESTIMHELGHAIQGYIGKDEHTPEAEKQAEKFADDYLDSGYINKFWEQ